MIKNYFVKKMQQAFDDNEAYIRSLIEKKVQSAKRKKLYLDVGCGSCEMTHRLFKNILDKVTLCGIDLFPSDFSQKIRLYKADLEKDRFPFDKKFDVVVSNQVIEHLLNKDHMIKEVYRVLKPGGIFILSTENISSFDNILSLLLGQEPVSQHTGHDFHTNSFLSPHFMEKLDPQLGNKYAHKNVCSYFGLKRLFEVHSFRIRQVRTFGNVFNLLEKLFPIYNRLITVVGEK